ncbi:MAG: pentapeptide repeat-containing protein, partial [Nonomuraea sp.]|nr:pentapeptide repeat-containing protein [Nonomuraea sp.]
VNELLLRPRELVRDRKGKDRRGADLIGKRMKGADLRAADLRGAYLIGADLRGADLRLADLIGADLRDTDLRGADLTGALFLTQAQVNAARGDSATRLPQALDRPAHWS